MVAFRAFLETTREKWISSELPINFCEIYDVLNVYNKTKLLQKLDELLNPAFTASFRSETALRWLVPDRESLNGKFTAILSDYRRGFGKWPFLKQQQLHLIFKDLLNTASLRWSEDAALKFMQKNPEDSSTNLATRSSLLIKIHLVVWILCKFNGLANFSGASWACRFYGWEDTHNNS